MPLQRRSPNRTAGGTARGAGGKNQSGTSSSMPQKVETRRLANAQPAFSWALRGGDTHSVPQIYLSLFAALSQCREPLPPSIRIVPDTIIFSASGPTTWFGFDPGRRRVEPHEAIHVTAANIMTYFREVMRSRELIDLSRGIPDEEIRFEGTATTKTRCSGTPRFPCAVWIYDGVDVEARDRQAEEDQHVCVEYLDLAGVQTLVDRLVSGNQPPHGVLQEFVATETPSATGTNEEYLATIQAVIPGQHQQQNQQQLPVSELFTKFSGTNLPLEVSSVVKFRNLHVPRTDNLASVPAASLAQQQQQQQQQNKTSATTINTLSFAAIPPIAALAKTISGLDSDFHQCMVRENEATFTELRQSPPGWSVTTAVGDPLLGSAQANKDCVQAATMVMSSISRDRDRFSDAVFTPLTRCTLWLKPLPASSSATAGSTLDKPQHGGLALLGVTSIKMPSIRLDYTMIDCERLLLEGNVNAASAAAAMRDKEQQQQQQQQQNQKKQSPRRGGGRSVTPRGTNNSPSRRNNNNNNQAPPAPAAARVRSSSPSQSPQRQNRVGQQQHHQQQQQQRPQSASATFRGVRRSDLDQLQRNPATVQQNVERIFEAGRRSPQQQHQQQSQQQLPPRPVSATQRPPRPTSALTRPVSPTAVTATDAFHQQSQTMHHQVQPQYPGGFHGNPGASSNQQQQQQPTQQPRVPQPPPQQSSRPQSASYLNYELRNRTPTPDMMMQQHQQQYGSSGAAPAAYGGPPTRTATPSQLQQAQHQQQPNYALGGGGGDTSARRHSSIPRAVSPFPHQPHHHNQNEMQQQQQQQNNSRIQYVYFPAVVQREEIGQRAAALLDTKPVMHPDDIPDELQCPNCQEWCPRNETFTMSYQSIAMAVKHTQKKNERVLKHVFPRKSKHSSQRKASSIDEVRNANTGDVLFADDFEWAPVPPVLQQIKVEVDELIARDVWRQRTVHLCENCAAGFWMPEVQARLQEQQQQQSNLHHHGAIGGSAILREIRGKDAIDLSLRAASPEGAGAGHLAGNNDDAIAQQNRPIRPYSAAHSQIAARHAIHEAPPVASCFSNVTDALVLTDLQQHHREIRQARRDKYAMRLVAADCHRGVDVFSANLAKQREIDSLLAMFVLPPQDLGVAAQIDDPLSLILSRELHSAVAKVCKEPPELALGVVMSRPAKGKGPWRIPKPVQNERGEYLPESDTEFESPLAIGEESANARRGRGRGAGGPTTTSATIIDATMQNDDDNDEIENLQALLSSPSASQRDRAEQRIAQRNNGRAATYRALIAGSQTFSEMNENERAAIVRFLGGDESALDEGED